MFELSANVRREYPEACEVFYNFHKTRAMMLGMTFAGVSLTYRNSLLERVVEPRLYDALTLELLGEREVSDRYYNAVGADALLLFAERYNADPQASPLLL